APPERGRAGAQDRRRAAMHGGGRLSEAQITLVVPYYRQPQMLARQLDAWGAYSDDVRQRFRFILVDDGSPEPALPIVRASGLAVEVYRVLVDIMWNQHGARNLGAQLARDGWLLMIDVDHVLLAENAERLLELAASLDGLDRRTWYWLRRRRTTA